VGGEWNASNQDKGIRMALATPSLKATGKYLLEKKAKA
jgi:hypothetical protein